MLIWPSCLGATPEPPPTKGGAVDASPEPQTEIITTTASRSTDEKYAVISGIIVIEAPPRSPDEMHPAASRQQPLTTEPIAERLERSFPACNLSHKLISSSQATIQTHRAKRDARSSSLPPLSHAAAVLAAPRDYADPDVTMAIVLDEAAELFAVRPASPLNESPMAFRDDICHHGNKPESIQAASAEVSESISWNPPASSPVFPTLPSSPQLHLARIPPFDSTAFNDIEGNGDSDPTQPQLDPLSVNTTEPAFVSSSPLNYTSSDVDPVPSSEVLTTETADADVFMSSSPPSSISASSTSSLGKRRREDSHARSLKITRVLRKPFVSPLRNTSTVEIPPPPLISSSPTAALEPTPEPARRIATRRVARPFKPPQAATAIPASATLRALEDRVRLLRQAVRFHTQTDEDARLEELVVKWRAAGREIAERLFDCVPKPEGGNGCVTWQGYNSLPLDRPSDVPVEHEDVDMVQEEEEEETDAPQWSYGSMMKQMGVDPAVLGWDEAEDDWCD